MHSQHRSPLPPAAPTRTVVVALPAGTPTVDLLDAAAARLAGAGFATAGGVAHFPARRGRARHFVDWWNGFTSGGAIARLDLAAMRHRAVLAAAAQWQWWRYVTASTPAARTWPDAWGRVEHDPRYPVDRAVRDFHAQPRVVAMQAHNALPGQRWPLPLQDLELFQAGHRTYTSLAWLAAVPGDGFVCVDGPLLQPHSERVADRIAYLRLANAHLEQLGRDAALVAVHVTGPRQGRVGGQARPVAQQPHPKGATA